jgi:hypothetical protein
MQEKNIFWIDFQLIKKQLWMVLDLIDLSQYHSPQKKLVQNSTHNFSFEIYL